MNKKSQFSSFVICLIFTFCNIHGFSQQKVWVKDKAIGTKVKGMICEIRTKDMNCDSVADHKKWAANVIPQLAAISLNVIGAVTKKKPERYASELTSINTPWVTQECLKSTGVEGNIKLSYFKKEIETVEPIEFRFYGFQLKNLHGILTLSVDSTHGDASPVRTRKKYDLIFEKLTFHLNGIVKTKKGSAFYGKEIGSFSLNNLIPSFRKKADSFSNPNLQIALPKLDPGEEFHSFSLSCTVAHFNPHGLSSSQWNEAFNDSKSSITEIINYAVSSETE